MTLLDNFDRLGKPRATRRFFGPSVTGVDVEVDGLAVEIGESRGIVG